MNTQEYTNDLIHETSPYLLQHAHNPVNWYPWGEKALNRAKEENKPILLSIGYSSCHWCHVMAHESFENPQVAEMMNANFINIKLDREERPDIDNIYMDAIQAMGLRGGWPLNVFLTPDQKPFYGGTYFPKEQWMSLLGSITDAYANKYEELYTSASKFAANINQSESQKYGLTTDPLKLTIEDFDSAFTVLEKKFDSEWGGMNRAPKFPMPSVWNFTMNYAEFSGKEEALKHTLFTLDKIAAGGIYDHVGGGFSRYSVDGEWHVPHFEKMLYDNGQLLGLYADAYKITQNSDYLDILLGTINWLNREMMDENCGFYSALDADSEGEEGKFYVWTYEEFKELAGDNFSLLAEYYDVSKSGNWEDGKNVLRRLESLEALTKELNINKEDLLAVVSEFKSAALEKRESRVRPGLDDKIIAGWNGLVLTGLCKSYQATNDRLILELAKKNAAFISYQLINDGRLLRLSGQKTEGFLEDYSAVIQSFITYYETTFDEAYLSKAKELTDVVIQNFYDEDEKLFFFSSQESELLIARKKELFDNVIPASNSIMAENLYRLGLMYDDDSYREVAVTMVNQINKLIKNEPEYLSNWATISMMMSQPTAEVLLVGDQSHEMAKTINSAYLPNKIIMATNDNSELPLFEYKNDPSKTTIYVCYDKVCERPTYNPQDAINQVHSSFRQTQ